MLKVKLVQEEKGKKSLESAVHLWEPPVHYSSTGVQFLTQPPPFLVVVVVVVSISA